MKGSGFTDAVRQELAGLELVGGRAPAAELSAIVRFGGSLGVKGGDPPELTIDVETTSGAVARRMFSLLGHRYSLRPQLMVRAAGGVRRTTYGVRVGSGAAGIARDLEVVDDRGMPTDALPAQLTGESGAAYLRGAFLTVGSISAPERPPHLEFTTFSPKTAQGLAALLARQIDATASIVPSGTGRVRVVIKSGERIGELLTLLGASNAFLDFDERRLRRQLRAEATRLANADRANVRRSIEASYAQVAAVEAALAAVGWDALPDDVRGVALARLANPEASLSELGELLDPPVSKSAVHRRLHRLLQLSDEHMDTRTPATEQGTEV